MVQGFIEWPKYGLAPGEEILAQSAEYFEIEDDVGQWLDECTQTFQSGVDNETTELHEHFSRWFFSRHLKPMNIKNFSLELTQRGFQRERDKKTRRSIIKNIRLDDHLYQPIRNQTQEEAAAL